MNKHEQNECNNQLYTICLPHSTRHLLYITEVAYKDTVRPKVVFPEKRNSSHFHEEDNIDEKGKIKDPKILKVVIYTFRQKKKENKRQDEQVADDDEVHTNADEIHIPKMRFFGYPAVVCYAEADPENKEDDQSKYYKKQKRAKRPFFCNLIY